ncbi:MAG TPA: hypothetical protein VF939_08975 [Puia sp.]
MNTWPKIALAAAGCGVLIYAYSRKMTRTKANLIVMPEVSVHSISLTGLVLRTDVQIKNPSDGHFSILFPFVTLTYKDTLLGSSKVINQDIAINAYSEANIQKILIDIPLSSVFSVVSTLIKTIQTKQPVKILVNVATVVNLGWSKINYADTQEIALKN